MVFCIEARQRGFYWVGPAATDGFVPRFAAKQLKDVFVKDPSIGAVAGPGLPDDKDTPGSWTFPKAKYEHVFALLQKSNIDVSALPALVESFFDIFPAPIKTVTPRFLKEYKGPQEILPYQKEGIIKGIELAGRFLLGDEPGVGKTLQAIGIASEFRQDWPVLVVVPSSLRSVWKLQLGMWGKSLCSPDEVQIIYDGKQAIESQSKFVVTSYELANIRRQKFINHKFKFLICDEAHKIKNLEAQRSKTIFELSQQANRIVLMTGTPIVNVASDVYNLLRVLAKDTTNFPSRPVFEERYFLKREAKFGKITSSDPCREHELHAILTSTVMIRRLKKDVIKDMPEKFRSPIDLDLSTVQDLKEFRKIMIDAPYDSLNDKDLQQLFHQTCGIKKEASATFVAEIVECTTDEKHLVFAHHVAMLDTLEKVVAKSLEPKGDSLIRICGKTPQKERGDLVAKFQEDPRCRVAILSITAASEGITLTAASSIIFAELHWTPSIMNQCEGRAHRMGQKNNVHIQYLLTPGEDSVDHKAYKALTEKQLHCDRAIDGLEKTSEKDLFPEQSREKHKILKNIEASKKSKLFPKRMVRRPDNTLDVPSTSSSSTPKSTAASSSHNPSDSGLDASSPRASHGSSDAASHASLNNKYSVWNNNNDTSTGYSSSKNYTKGEGKGDASAGYSSSKNYNKGKGNYTKGGKGFNAKGEWKGSKGSFSSKGFISGRGKDNAVGSNDWYVGNNSSHAKGKGKEKGETSFGETMKKFDAATNMVIPKSASHEPLPVNGVLRRTRFGPNLLAAGLQNTPSAVTNQGGGTNQNASSSSSSSAAHMTTTQGEGSRKTFSSSTPLSGPLAWRGPPSAAAPKPAPAVQKSFDASSVAHWRSTAKEIPSTQNRTVNNNSEKEEKAAPATDPNVLKKDSAASSPAQARESSSAPTNEKSTVNSEKEEKTQPTLETDALKKDSAGLSTPQSRGPASAPVVEKSTVTPAKKESLTAGGSNSAMNWRGPAVNTRPGNSSNNKPTLGAPVAGSSSSIINPGHTAAREPSGPAAWRGPRTESSSSTARPAPVKEMTGPAAWRGPRTEVKSCETTKKTDSSNQGLPSADNKQALSSSNNSHAVGSTSSAQKDLKTNEGPSSAASSTSQQNEKTGASDGRASSPPSSEGARASSGYSFRPGIREVISRRPPIIRPSNPTASASDVPTREVIRPRPVTTMRPHASSRPTYPVAQISGHKRTIGSIGIVDGPSQKVSFFANEVIKTPPMAPAAGGATAPKPAIASFSTDQTNRENMIDLKVGDKPRVCKQAEPMYTRVSMASSNTNNTKNTNDTNNTKNTNNTNNTSAAASDVSAQGKTKARIEGCPSSRASDAPSSSSVKKTEENVGARKTTLEPQQTPATASNAPRTLSSASQRPQSQPTGTKLVQKSPDFGGSSAATAASVSKPMERQLNTADVGARSQRPGGSINTPSASNLASRTSFSSSKPHALSTRVSSTGASVSVNKIASKFKDPYASRPQPPAPQARRDLVKPPSRLPPKNKHPCFRIQYGNNDSSSARTGFRTDADVTGARSGFRTDADVTGARAGFRTDADVTVRPASGARTNTHNAGSSNRQPGPLNEWPKAASTSLPKRAKPSIPTLVIDEEEEKKKLDLKSKELPEAGFIKAKQAETDRRTTLRTDKGLKNARGIFGVMIEHERDEQAEAELLQLESKFDAQTELERKKEIENAGHLTKLKLAADAIRERKRLMSLREVNVAKMQRTSSPV